MRKPFRIPLLYNTLVILAILLFAFPAKADTVGDRHSFFVDPSYDIRNRSQIDATMLLESARAYFYVEDIYWNNLNVASQQRFRTLIDGLSVAFNQTIYPIETAAFGSEPNPGIDGDPHITILVTSMKSTIGGYFDTSNERSKSEIPTSNAREMIAINANGMSDLQRMAAFVAHEFQHLISYNQKELLQNVTDDVWINELRSEYAITLAGYNMPYEGSTLERRAQTFLQTPTDSLTEWKNLLSDYSAIDIFGEYLLEHWGNRVIENSVRSGRVGIPSLDVPFKDVFTNWLVATILNDTTRNPLFGYTRPELRGLRVSPTVLAVPAQGSLAIQADLTDWQPQWYDLQSLAPSDQKILVLKFTSSSLGSFQVPYLLGKSDGNYELKTVDFLQGGDQIIIPNIGTDITRVIVMPFKKDKLSGFGSSEPTVDLELTVTRTAVMPTPAPVVIVSPAQFNLGEGDFIRAEGDYNVYIINDFGYKRLVLSPAICLLYKHLGARGCFDAVKVVKPEVRDAFRTSNYYANGETNDGKIFLLEITGEDSAILKEEIFSGDINSIFIFNTREQKSYPLFSSTQ